MRHAPENDWSISHSSRSIGRRPLTARKLVLESFFSVTPMLSPPSITLNTSQASRRGHVAAESNSLRVHEITREYTPVATGRAVSSQRAGRRSKEHQTDEQSLLSRRAH